MINVINPTEAAKLFKQITGKRKSVARLTEEVHRYPHLGVFDFTDQTGRPKLTGIRLARWQYFVKARFALWGRDGIFHDYDVDN
ncbi:MAG: hypothetical protein ACRCTY_02600 [Candidatus Adiutrix sp.]